MKPKLKIGGIRNLHDARYCSAVGISLLGFEMSVMAPDPLSGKDVGEIMGWLSGPESIGEFGYESPAEIIEAIGGEALQYISIPMDYPQGLARDFTLPLIWRSKDPVLNVAGLSALQERMGTFPNSLFEFSIEAGDEAALNFLQDTGLMERSLLRFDAPEPFYEMIGRKGSQAFGFSLGKFVEDPEGIDYEACDVFLEQLQELHDGR